uniref:C-type lectin domain-containing protein n=1 Tax=Sander lucioperca TaxID=283035 RepID=A0A8C9Z4X0_SANLU
MFFRYQDFQMPRCLIRVSLNWNRGAELKGCRRTLLRRFDKLYKEGISSFTDSHQLDLLCVNHSSPQQRWHQAFRLLCCSVCPSDCWLHLVMDKTPAQNFCKSDGGNLASVHSEEEHVFLRTFINQVTGENITSWIGGSDSVQEGEWMWSDGSTFDYKHWDKGQPDNKGGVENCLQMNYEERDWNDAPCNIIYPFLCSKKL